METLAVGQRREPVVPFPVGPTHRIGEPADELHRPLSSEADRRVGDMLQQLRRRQYIKMPRLAAGRDFAVHAAE